jgi:transposase
MAFNSRLADWQKELESGQRHPDHDKQYTKYFEAKSTPVRGTKVVAKEEALAGAKRNYGYFALLCNDIMEPIEALEIYRNKGLVEKAFDNLKSASICAVWPFHRNKAWTASFLCSSSR